MNHERILLTCLTFSSSRCLLFLFFPPTIPPLWRSHLYNAVVPRTQPTPLLILSHAHPTPPDCCHSAFISHLLQKKHQMKQSSWSRSRPSSVGTLSVTDRLLLQLGVWNQLVDVFHKARRWPFGFVWPAEGEGRAGVSKSRLAYQPGPAGSVRGLTGEGADQNGRQHEEVPHRDPAPVRQVSRFSPCDKSAGRNLWAFQTC